jgi:hypothetical protein
MNLSAVEVVELDTAMSPAEARAALVRALDPDAASFGGYGVGLKPLWGEVSAERVVLRPVRAYGGEFGPELQGRVEGRPGGARLVGTVGPHPAWFVADLLCVGAVTLATVAGAAWWAVALAQPLWVAWALTRRSARTRARRLERVLEPLLAGPAPTTRAT